MAFVLGACLLNPALGLGGELDEKIENVLQEKRLEGATVGVSVIKVDSGDVLYSRNADQSMIPASNGKIVTAATALRELGEDYEFKTSLWIDGYIDTGGVLEGGLLLVGKGDPTIGSWDFQEGIEDRSESADMTAKAFEDWAGWLAQHGVRRIRGEILLDASFFDNTPTPPDWPEGQMWRHYCAPVGGLTYQNGCVRVIVKPGAKAGEPANVRLKPPVPGLSVRNSCDTKPQKHLIWFDRDAGSSVIQVGGDVRKDSVGYAGWVTVPDPVTFAGQALAHEVRSAGIQLDGRVRRVVGKPGGGQWRRLFQRRVPLLDVLRIMMVNSVNPYAEHVVKTMGAEIRGEGSWGAGLKVMTKSMERLGLASEPFRLADGSGMSRRNRVTAQLMSGLLREMANGPKDDVFRRLLAKPGEGTLDRRFRQEPYRSSVWAKTGFLRGVGALSGYARTREGDDVAFSILINDFSRGSNPDMKQIEDRIVRAIVDIDG